MPQGISFPLGAARRLTNGPQMLGFPVGLVWVHERLLPPPLQNCRPQLCAGRSAVWGGQANSSPSPPPAVRLCSRGARKPTQARRVGLGRRRASLAALPGAARGAAGAPAAGRVRAVAARGGAGRRGLRARRAFRGVDRQGGMLPGAHHTYRQLRAASRRDSVRA